MRYWLLNALCGLLLLFLLGIHMTTLHLDDLLSLISGADPEPLSWARVTRRGQSLLVSVTYVIFLGSALFHGLYGLHTMLTEFLAGRRAARLVLVGCWSIGLLLFIVGTVTTVSFHLLSRGP